MLNLAVIPECPGYGISPDGLVVGPSGRQLNPAVGKYGHLYITAYRGGKKWYIHRLVAKAYLPEPAQDQLEVRHLDGNPANNSVSNLAWGTRLENYQDSIAHGTATKPPTKQPKFSKSQVVYLYKLYSRGMTQLKLSELTGLPQGTITRILDVDGIYREYLQNG
jgi:hypothetical protein